MAFAFGRPQISISQEYAQWLGKLSNCNVVIQQRMNAGLMNAIRLYCTECYGSKDLTDIMVVRGESMVTALGDPLVKEFAIAHSHKPEVTLAVAISSEGRRRFRDDE
jgi:hypothetical protein